MDAIVLEDEDGNEVYLHPAVPDWAVDLHVVRAHALDNPPLRSLVLTITDRCNLRCDFCCHPHLDSEIPADDCLRLAREACELDFCEVWLTGGESFLRYELVLDLARICRANRRMLGVQTSGYWARAPERAARMAREMIEAGVFVVTFSWDSSHGAFVTPTTVQQGIDACMEAGLHVHLRGNFVNPDTTHEQHGFDLARHHRYANFSVAVGPVVPAGRGAGLVDLRRTKATAEEAAAFRCPGHAELEHVLYARDGMTMPCCGLFAGYATPALGLGDWRTRSLAESAAAHDSDPYFRTIADHGFARLYEQIATRDVETASRLPDPQELSTACELCARLMQSPDAARIRALAGER